MKREEVFPIEKYIDIGLRRKWWIIIPFILSVIVTTVLYWRLPKIYRSDTLILVLPQKVPEGYVRSTVTTPVTARLRTISEEILSRTRLGSIINELNLYPKLREKKPMDLIIDKMRDDIEIKVHRQSSFRIYYKGKDPKIVRTVTSKLASLFIEENLKTREQQARVTTDFLSKQLESVKNKLEEQEKAITAFKFKHMGSLPDQTEANLAVLEQLSEQRHAIDERISRTENQRLLMQTQLAEGVRFITRNDEVELASNLPLDRQLHEAKNMLIALRTIYTDEHIEVKKLKERVRQLENQLNSDEKDDIEDENSNQTQVRNPLKTQLDAINMEIENLKKQQANINKQIALYQKRLEETPKVELQLANLTRDYNDTKRFYEELLQKKLHAEQAENLERRQQGEQFKILDPASLPRIPYKPNPYRVFPMGVILGLGTGFGLAFMREMMDKSFRNPKDVEEYLGVPVLASIPLIKKSSQLIADS